MLWSGPAPGRSATFGSEANAAKLVNDDLSWSRRLQLTPHVLARIIAETQWCRADTPGPAFSFQGPPSPRQR